MDSQNNQAITIMEGQSAQPFSPEAPIHTIEWSPSQIGLGLDAISGAITTTIATAAAYLKAGDTVVLKIPRIQTAGVGVVLRTVTDINS